MRFMLRTNKDRVLSTKRAKPKKISSKQHCIIMRKSYFIDLSHQKKVLQLNKASFPLLMSWSKGSQCVPQALQVTRI